MDDLLLKRAVAAERSRFVAAAGTGDPAGAWRALERAHILSQPLLIPHLRVHGWMLIYALRLGDIREVAGQALRLALAPLGAVTGRTPAGNNGRARVSAFAPMAVPPDIQAILARALGAEGRLGRE
ncbi:DUF3703 domain-containing protein [Sphingopyxis sp. MWB1]|uniref:DUF3703 domain-containing protein n=1 Tax=Sphingopyxis sp. MWB1 TaxID=1537715 RepID=UPI00051A3762|nr:DUF3703 domain-containing protein [Sphingopyxis sp. MWB1]